MNLVLLAAYPATFKMKFYLAFKASTMGWDKIKIAQTFLRKANAIHPEEEQVAETYDRALARQNVFYDCYMSSFSREALVKRLEAVIAGGVDSPEEDVDPERYREAYMNEARKLLLSIERGDMP